MADGSTPIEPEDREAFLKLARYPLNKHCDMEADMRTEAQQILVSAFEKFCGGANPQYDKACEMAKEAMDKKFGGPWNCVMGAGFSFEIQSEAKHILYMFNLGTTALLLWKP